MPVRIAIASLKKPLSCFQLGDIGIDYQAHGKSSQRAICTL
jgi:hypothetical protein